MTAVRLFCSLEPRVAERVKEVGDLLLSLKPVPPMVANNQSGIIRQTTADAEDVLQPLMDLLDGW